MRATNTPSFLVLCVAYHVVFALVSSHDHHHHHRGLPPVFVRANQPVVRFRNKTVGILAEGGGNVFVSSDNVTIAGDVEVTRLCVGLIA